MKYLVGLFLLMSLVGCGSDETRAIERKNIFFESGNDQVSVEASSNEFIGLWESEVYQENDMDTQLRWKLTESETFLAKKCTHSSGQVVYVQVKLPFAESSSLSTSNLSPFALPAPESEQQVYTDVKPIMDKACRVSIDISNIVSDSVIASGTDEYEIGTTDTDQGLIELLVGPNQESYSLKQIGF